jgi:large subunit ribosomal protein L21
MSSEAKAYAIIKTGGKQYRVEKDKTYKFETLEGLGEGSSVEFTEILLHSDGEKISIGEPLLENVKVSGQVVENGRNKKINVLKFKRRKNYMRRYGHRQNYTAVQITQIG